MRFETVCFVFEIPPLDIYFERYDMGLLIKNGYKVTVCDLSPILHPIAYNQRSVGLLEEKCKVPVYHIYNKHALKTLMKQQDNTFYISTLPVFGKSYSLIKQISKKHYGFACNVDYVPKVPVKEKVHSIGFWTKWTKERILEAIFARLPKKYLPVTKADVVITYTDKGLNKLLNNTLWNSKTKIMLTNTLDYNECLKALKQNERIINEEYCLFIDQFLPFHSDGKENNIHIDPDEYYYEIRLFLSSLERILGKKVVIAGHPRGDYEKYAKYYKGFEVFQFCTCRLVKDASIVISHASISLSFVMIFQKKLLLISTDEMEAIEAINNSLASAGEMTHHRIINISKVKNDKEIIAAIEEINQESTDYKEQRSYYCLQENQENSKFQFGEIIINAISKI